MDSTIESDNLKINEPATELALSRFNIIKPLVEQKDSKRKRSDVQTVSRNSGVSVATLYRWVSKYESSGHISSLDNDLRSDIGKPRISEQLISIIDNAYTVVIRDRTSKFKISRVIEKVFSQCSKEGLNPPHPNTVRCRIKLISSKLLKDQIKVRLRENIEAALRKGLDNNSASIEICKLLDSELGLLDQGIFDDDPEMLAMLDCQ